MDDRGLGARLPLTRRGLVRISLAAAAMLVATGIVAACETAPPRPEPPPLSYAGLPPLAFDLGRIRIVEPAAAPHPSDVDHLFPTPPSVAIGQWVADRLRAVGAVGTLRVTIEEASARATPLVTNEDLEGLFTEEQAERLDLRLRVTIEAIDASGAVNGSATADVERSRTLPEGITLDERERLYDEIVAALLHDYNASQEQAIRQYLHLYLR